MQVRGARDGLSRALYEDKGGRLKLPAHMAHLQGAGDHRRAVIVRPRVVPLETRIPLDGCSPRWLSDGQVSFPHTEKEAWQGEMDMNVIC